MVLTATAEIPGIQQERVQRIEQETGIRVPSFIADLKPIDRDQAIKLAEDLHLMPEKGRPYGGREDVCAWLGTLFCRSHNVDILGAYGLEKESYSHLTKREMFEHFNKPMRGTDIAIAVSDETARREKRDLELLHLEQDILRKRGIEVPEFETLLDYCEWVPEGTGYNERERQWAKESDGSYHPNGYAPDVIYWDLLSHYGKIIARAREVSDPLYDWESHFTGYSSLTAIGSSWNIKGFGEDGNDISYFGRFKDWKRVDVRPTNKTYDKTLITHTTSTIAAKIIYETGYINSDRVCFAAGQVVSVNSNPGSEMTFVFPRQVIEQVYAVKPYSEPMSPHEREMRSHEPISLAFCIGCIPFDKSIYHQIHGTNEGTRATGRNAMRRWGEYYVKTGKLLPPEDEVLIKNIADKN